MSQSTAVTATRLATRPAPRTAQRTPTRASPRLRVVSPPSSARSRAGLVVASLALLTVGLLGLLLLNVSLDKGAFTLHNQQTRIDQLTEQRQALQEQLAALEAPQSLAAKASALGMVQAGSVAFVRSDGSVLGVPLPAVAPRATSVTASGSASATASPTAAGTTASQKAAATGKVQATSTATGKPATAAKASGPKATAKPASRPTATKTATN